MHAYQQYFSVVCVSQFASVLMLTVKSSCIYFTYQTRSKTRNMAIIKYSIFANPHMSWCPLPLASKQQNIYNSYLIFIYYMLLLVLHRCLTRSKTFEKNFLSEQFLSVLIVLNFCAVGYLAVRLIVLIALFYDYPQYRTCFQ